MRQSADENTSRQRGDNDGEHTGDMPLYSREDHGGRTFSRLHEGQVQEGPRRATRCVPGTTLHTAKTTKQAPKQFYLIYCTSYSLFTDIVTLTAGDASCNAEMTLLFDSLYNQNFCNNSQ